MINIKTKSISSFTPDLNNLIQIPGDIPIILTGRALGDCGPSGHAGHAKRELIGKAETISVTQVHGQSLVLISDAHIEYYNAQFNNRNEIDTDCMIINKEDIGSTRADGIITLGNESLGVTVADCMPIAIRSQNAKALLHSGWQGTGIFQLALMLMAEKDWLMGKVYIHFGPSISWQDYAVPSERAELFRQRFGMDSVKTLPDGQPALDLIAANLSILKNFAHAHPYLDFELEICEGSTFRESHYQSYRRDGQNYARSLVIV